MLSNVQRLARELRRSTAPAATDAQIQALPINNHFAVPVISWALVLETQ
jgi:hypothetical protein